ncbi:MAG: anhydro-N-acetylmuramic acid kinase [Bacteroidia bacterium]
MSGTSTDGLDIISVELFPEDENIRYKILKTKFIPYTDEFSLLLKSSPSLSGRGLRKLDVELGIYFGNEVKKFCQENDLYPDLIASHGHTVFHQPDEGYTMQIACGAALAATCGCPVVNDFRQGDVSLGGQGAPLVPIGDALLFSEYDYCVNLGGFANISCETKIKKLPGIFAP